MANTDIPGELASYKIWLSPSVDAQQRYQRRYVPVDIVEGGTAEDRLLFTGKGERIWEIRSWKGGEGNQHWKRGDNRYRTSDGIRPNRYDDGLTLDAFHHYPTLSGTSNDVVLAGVLEDTIWLITRNPGATGNMYGLNLTAAGTGNWVSTNYLTGTSQIPFTATVLGSSVYIAFGDGSIRKVNPTAGTNALVITGGVGPWGDFPPMLTAYQGQLFALGTDDLYIVDHNTTDTWEHVVDNNADNQDWIAENHDWYVGHARMVASDVGPIWFDRDDAGTTVVWQYNVAAETSDIIGQLPQFSGPTSIFWLRGTIAVAFLENGATAGNEGGRAFLYLKSGGQESIVGPLRDDAFGDPVVCGAWGRYLITYYSGYLWGYDLSTGGLFRIAGSGAADDWARATFMYGQYVLVHNNPAASGVPGVEWWTLEKHHEPTAEQQYSTLHSGHFDFDQPGFPKRLIDVTVLSDDLPAATSIDVAVTVDRGDQFISGTPSTTEGANLHTFDFSTDTHNLVGFEFELELRLDYNGSALTAASPVVRSIYARSVSGATVREWVLAVDLNRTGEHFPVGGTLTDFVDALEEHIDTHGQIEFVDPWMVREGATPTSFDVTIEELSFLHTDSGDLDYAVIRLRNDDWI